jgi:hypothetical protein
LGKDFDACMLDYLLGSSSRSGSRKTEVRLYVYDGEVLLPPLA